MSECPFKTEAREIIERFYSTPRPARKQGMSGFPDDVFGEHMKPLSQTDWKQGSMTNVDRLCEKCGHPFVTDGGDPGHFCINCLDGRKQGMNHIHRFQPLQGFYIIKPDEYFGGADNPVMEVHLRAKGSLGTGMVVSCGPGTFQTLSGITGPMYAEVGQRVMYYQASAQEAKFGEHAYVLVENSALIAIIID